jgi:hypothetical protein
MRTLLDCNASMVVDVGTTSCGACTRMSRRFIIDLATPEVFLMYNRISLYLLGIVTYSSISKYIKSIHRRSGLLDASELVPSYFPPPLNRNSMIRTRRNILPIMLINRRNTNNPARLDRLQLDFRRSIIIVHQLGERSRRIVVSSTSFLGEETGLLATVVVKARSRGALRLAEQRPHEWDTG